MPRFALKELLLAITLVAIGLGLIVAVFASKPAGAIWPELGTPFIVGAASIGGGLLAPFKKAWIGAVIGALVALVFSVVLGANVIMRM